MLKKYMKIKYYILVSVVVISVIAIMCISQKLIFSSSVQYSTTYATAYNINANTAAYRSTQPFSSVTPRYNTTYANPTHITFHTDVAATQGSVFSDHTFATPQMHSFGESAIGTQITTTNTFHANSNNNITNALAINIPHMPTIHNTRATDTHTTTANALAAASAPAAHAPYKARSIAMLSNNITTTGSATVASIAMTTYDQGYSISNGINNRHNAIDLGDGDLPENPIEPGTPVGDVPWIYILCLSLAYALLKYRKRIATLFILCIIASTSFAVPAYRGWQTKTQPDGTTIEVRLTGDEFHHYWQDQAGNVVKCDSLGYWRVVESQPTPATIKARRQASAMLQSRPQKAVGAPNLAPRGLVILVNFNNSKFAAANTQVAMNDLMNSSSYTHNGATGSVRQFFSDQSDGQYTPEFDVFGPVTLTNNVAHYGSNDASGNDVLTGDMVVEACSIANASYGVDFTKYDNDSDGEVDFVYIIYAGKGEADGGADNTIWPHNWSLDGARYWNNCSYTTAQSRFDGKYINNYACSGELSGAGARTGIGTIAHEFGHVIGLPDLYDIDYGQNYEDEATPGAWHIMDGGSYNNDGKTPPNYTIYDKYFLGWKTPINPGNTPQTLTLQAAGTNGYNAYQITSDNSLLAATSTTTAYYIENRQQSGWDKYLPGHGLVIWKIMYDQSVWNDNAPNATPGTIRYAVVSASGATTKIGTAADPFPGTKKITQWEGVNGKPLLNITEKNGIISLSYIEEVDESICTYKVIADNATISSESGEVKKGETLTLTVEPLEGYVLDNTMIIVYQSNEERDFIYSGTTLTITDVQGNLEIGVFPEEQSNTFRVTWIANGEVLTDANATHAYTSGDALLMPSTEVNACSGMEFVGWTAIKDYQNPFCPPTDLFHTAEDKTVTANITYYAVYKTN